MAKQVSNLGLGLSWIRKNLIKKGQQEVADHLGIKINSVRLLESHKVGMSPTIGPEFISRFVELIPNRGDRDQSYNFLLGLVECAKLRGRATTILDMYSKLQLDLRLNSSCESLAVGFKELDDEMQRQIINQFLPLYSGEE